MPAFFLTNKAVADLLEIGRYTEQKWGQAQRNKYLSLMDDCFHFLAANPFSGIDCGDIRAGYRKNSVGFHVIFYKKLEDDNIQSVRVLHSRVNYSAHLP
jgi:toxin ParE1/3/4